MTKEDINKWVDFHKYIANRHRFQTERAWETIKLFILVFSSLISIYFTLIIAMFKFEIIVKIPFYLRLFILSIFPFFLFLVCIVGWLNFRRQCRRMYELISILIKVQEKLGLLNSRTENKYFPEDKYYVSDGWLPNQRNSQEFINDLMKKRDTFYGIMKKYFFIFIMFSCLLMAVGIYLSIL